MANHLKLPHDHEYIDKMLAKAFQSGSINFLLGSGASTPAMPLVGTLETDLENLFKEGKNKEANKKLYDFLIGLQTPTNLMLKNTANANNATSINNYKTFVSAIEKILIERKSNILPKQANIFTTNYDLLIEKACEQIPILKLNDGFLRKPNLANNFTFSTQGFFNSTFNNGNLYNYTVQIPNINLIKIHGSLSWKKEKDEIVYEVSTKESLVTETEAEIEKYNNQYALILPHKAKFRETLLDRTYYDLLRIYANELDKENTLLMAFGFSFADEHIYDITKRALKNPALKLVIFSYSHAEVESFEKKFQGYNNVDIISEAPEEFINFLRFNKLISDVLPNAEKAKAKNG